MRIAYYCADVAGIFIPSLVVGACFGRVVGLVMEYVEHSLPNLPMFQGCDGECIVPGLYAMVRQNIDRTDGLGRRGCNACGCHADDGIAGCHHARAYRNAKLCGADHDGGPFGENSG